MKSSRIAKISNYSIRRRPIIPTFLCSSDYIIFRGCPKFVRLSDDLGIGTYTLLLCNSQKYQRLHASTTIPFDHAPYKTAKIHSIPNATIP